MWRKQREAASCFSSHKSFLHFHKNVEIRKKKKKRELPKKQHQRPVPPAPRPPPTLRVPPPIFTPIKMSD